MKFALLSRHIIDLSYLDWIAYQSEFNVDHIKAEHNFLAAKIEPVSTADFILQELDEGTFSVSDHDKILRESSKFEQSNVLLGKIIENNGVLLNCFLYAIHEVRHVLPGPAIMKQLRKSDTTKGNIFTTFCPSLRVIFRVSNYS